VTVTHEENAVRLGRNLKGKPNPNLMLNLITKPKVGKFWKK